MGRRQTFEIPEGWVACGFRFEVEPTTGEQQALICQHFGAHRFAHNWALAQVKANLDARKADPAVAPLGWSLPTLRRAWNQAKQEVAPWWRECSKEAYSSGIADLVAALCNWSEAKHGHRAGQRVGFPRFKARRRDRGRVRFTTGAMRLEPDRRHLTVPVIGRLRSKENTRRLQRLVAKGRARILSMTLSEHGGRLYVSVATIVCHPPRTPAEPDARCGIDLGIGGEWAVIAHRDGSIQRITHPAPWAAAQKQRQPVARQLSRRIVGSRGHRQASAKLAALDRRATNLRANQIHLLTTSLAPLRHRRGRGPRRRRDGPWDGQAGVPPQRRPGGTRRGPADAGLQVLVGGWPAAGRRPVVRVVQDPPRLRRLSGRSQAQPAGMDVPGVWGDRGPQRQCGPESS